MSNFFRNIINRHASDSNIVRPRTKSVFEKKESYTGVKPSFSEGEMHVSDSSNEKIERPSLFVSEDSVDSTIEDSVNHLKRPEINTSQVKKTVNDSKTTKAGEGKKAQSISKSKPAPKSNSKKEAVANRLSNRKKNAIEPDVNNAIEPDVNNAINDVNEKVILNTITKVNRIIENASNPLKEDNAEIQFEKALSKEVVLPIQIEKTPLSFNKEIQQDLISNLQINHYNDNTSIVKEHTSTNQVSAPTIKVQIGRIDIKAVKQSPTKQINSRKRKGTEKSLEQFLKKRENT